MEADVWSTRVVTDKLKCKLNAGFRLTCRLPHCRFDDDICSTAQASLAAEGSPSGKQRQANYRSITLLTAADRKQLNSIQLWSDCRSVKSQSGVAAEPESCNSETASDDHAAKRRAAS